MLAWSTYVSEGRNVSQPGNLGQGKHPLSLSIVNRIENTKTVLLN